jgi:hypothetical protein
LVVARIGNKKQKRSSNGDPNETLPSEIGQDDDEGVEANALTRLIGKKKAKATLRQEKKKCDNNFRKYVGTKERN